MTSVFITGTPTAGKSTLAKKIAESLGMQVMRSDDLRDEMQKNPILEPWVNFYWNKNEAEYYASVTPEEQWRDLVLQSDAFWPTMKKNILNVLESGTPTIFEGVNLLPHLMNEVLIPGIVLVNSSEEEIFERLKKASRWGETEELQRIEAHIFFSSERPGYLREAEQYGIPAFSDSVSAEAILKTMIL